MEVGKNSRPAARSNPIIVVAKERWGSRCVRLRDYRFFLFFFFFIVLFSQHEAFTSSLYSWERFAQRKLLTTAFSLIVITLGGEREGESNYSTVSWIFISSFSRFCFCSLTVFDQRKFLDKTKARNTRKWCVWVCLLASLRQKEFGLWIASRYSFFSHTPRDWNRLPS